MAGIIRGFLAGASNAMADAGKLMLINQLQTERDEANGLRDRALRTDLQTSSQEFQRSESDKTIAATAARDDKTIAADKEAARYKTETVSADVKYATDNKPPKNPQLIKRTDSKGQEQEYLLEKDKDGKPVVIDPVTGKQLSETLQADLKLTKDELENAAAALNVEQGNKWWFTKVSPKDDEARVRALQNREKPTDINAPFAESASKPGEAKAAQPKKDYSEMLGIDKPKESPEATPGSIPGIKDAGASTAKPGSVLSAMAPGRSPVDIDRGTPDINMPVPKPVEIGIGGRDPMDKKNQDILEEQIMSVAGSKSGSDKNRERIYSQRAVKMVRNALNNDGPRVTSRAILEAALKSRDMTVEEDNKIKAILNK